MARVAAAFGSSHSVMLAAELQDWLRGFRQSDLRMKYYDRKGKPHDLLLLFDETTCCGPEPGRRPVRGSSEGWQGDGKLSKIAALTEIRYENVNSHRK